MTPEERFERIETQMELLMRYLTESAERFEERMARLEKRADQTSRDAAKVSAAVDKVSADVAKLVGCRPTSHLSS